jgi:preprotein translocase subunit YajC
MKKALLKICAAASPFFAFAATVRAAEGEVQPEGGLGGFLPIVGYLVFFGGIMYLMVYMPQKRKDKKAKELMNSLQVGHRVTTHSGIVGKVVNIKDDVVTVESGVERTQLEVKKWAIRDVDKPVEA